MQNAPALLHIRISTLALFFKMPLLQALIIASKLEPEPLAIAPIFNFAINYSNPLC
jgi:hypothetical protein